MTSQLSGDGPDGGAAARPLRILLATLTDLARPTGVAHSLRAIRSGLAARGHAVETLACPFATVARPTLARRAWRRISPSTEEVRRIAGARQRMAGSPALRGGHDVCLAFEAWSAGVCAAAGVPTVLRVAGLGSITDEWVRNGFVAAGSSVVPRLRAWERDGTDAARHVVVLGRTSADAMRALGVEDDRLTVIHNAVETPPVDARPSEPEPRGDALRIVTVGNLRAVKGADVLAAALAALPDDVRGRIELVHVGEGDDAGNPTFVLARDTLVAAGVRHTFRGAVPHDAVWALLRSAHVFAFPSRVESFGNALVEAIAVGLPVAASDVGAVREILGGDAVGAGLVVPPDDPDALADALTRLLGSPDLRREWSRRNAERARTHFSPGAMLHRYEAVLSGVV